MRAVTCMEEAAKEAGRKLRILAVADPAVQGYPQEKILENAPLACSMDILPWKEYYPAMMDSFQGRRDYDIVMVAGHLWLKELADQGFLAPVDAPEGTAARPKLPSSSSTSTSTVGLPRLSRISRP